MSKTILITGSTDGIGLTTMKQLVSDNHTLLVHGRTEEKVKRTVSLLKKVNQNIEIKGYVSDLSDFDQVRELASSVKNDYKHLDVLINNAGVYHVPNPKTPDNLDLRFMVNTIAPYLLTKELLPVLTKTSRVINLSSAAQAPVNINALKSYTGLSAGDAYVQSKLALTQWTFLLSKEKNYPQLIAVNPKSFLGSNMVKTAYGIEGHDLRIGADILIRLALHEEYNNKTGFYFDNDYGRISNPHPNAMNSVLNKQVVDALEEILSNKQ